MDDIARLDGRWNAAGQAMSETTTFDAFFRALCLRREDPVRNGSDRERDTSSAGVSESEIVDRARPSSSSRRLGSCGHVTILRMADMDPM